MEILRILSIIVHIYADKPVIALSMLGLWLTIPTELLYIHHHSFRDFWINTPSREFLDKNLLTPPGAVDFSNNTPHPDPLLEGEGAKKNHILPVSF